MGGKMSKPKSWEKFRFEYKRLSWLPWAKWKYVLTSAYIRVRTNLNPEEDIHTEFIHLYKSGVMIQLAGYAWNGESVSPYDTASSMRPSCGHDAGYQLISEGLLPPETRTIIDEEYGAECIKDGMWKWRVKRIRLALLKKFGGGFCKS